MKPSKRVGPANLLIRYKDAEVVYEPLGVVLALVSWNYPVCRESTFICSREILIITEAAQHSESDNLCAFHRQRNCHQMF